MGRFGVLEDEPGSRINNRWNRLLQAAILVTDPLLCLLLGLNLLLLTLLLFNLAASPPHRVSRQRGRWSERRQSDCDDELPLHNAEVTTLHLNGK
jgi:hypothetical protein